MHEFPVVIPPASTRDPERLNAPFLALAGKMKGLNEQDLSEGLLSVEKIYPRAVSDVQMSITSVDPSVTTELAGHFFPRGTDPGVVELSDSLGWQTISSVTISTGEDVLWIVGDLQFWNTSDFDHFQSVYPSRVQVSVSVDGSVQMDALTGQENVSLSAPYQLTETDHAFKGYDEWDSRHVERLLDATGIGPPHRSVRVVFSVPVAEGTHTVSLVARRANKVYTSPQKGTWGNYKGADAEHRRDENDPDANHNTDTVYIGSRFVAAVRCGGWQGSASTPSNDFQPEVLEDQQILTAAKITTQRLEGAQNVLNGIKPGDIQRGALRHEHLPAIVDVAHQETHAGTDTSMDQYTGHEDANGHNIITNDNDGAGFDFSDGEGWVCIMADADVKFIGETTQPSANDDKPGSFFVFGKLVLYDGANNTIPGTERFLSNEVYQFGGVDTVAGGTTPPYVMSDGRFAGTIDVCWENLSLTWVGRVEDLPLQTFESVRVLITTHNATSGVGDVEVLIKRRNLSVFRVRR